MRIRFLNGSPRAPRRRHKSGAGPGKRITNMNYGDRLRDTVIPEMQGMRKDAACRQFPGRVSSRVIVDFKGKSAVASPPKNPIFPVPLLLRATPGERDHLNLSPPTNRGSSRTILSNSTTSLGHGKSLRQLMEARRTFAEAKALTHASLQPG